VTWRQGTLHLLQRHQMTRSTAILWFKPTCLRVLDHEPLVSAHSAHSEVLHVFCHDPRWFATTSLGVPRTGRLRAKFMAEGVEDLSKTLAKHGQRLLVCNGRPEQVLPTLVRATSANEVLTHTEFCTEELQVQESVMRAVKEQGCSFRALGGGATLFHLDDLPWALSRAFPSCFSDFRRQLDRSCKIRDPVAAPSEWKRAPEQAFIAMSALAPDKWLSTQMAGNVTEKASTGESAEAAPTECEAPPADSPSPAIDYSGGESAAWKRVEHFFWETDALRTYHDTRNGMLGESYSSKLSAWLALGCISARSIAKEILRYERERPGSTGPKWLLFELQWRDFFRLSSKIWGASLFKLGGPKRMSFAPGEWSRDEKLLKRWTTGTTGVPFVDACMRELKLTGFMSNRGRQNVASYLINDMHIDWRLGALWFECNLVDHDPSLNYGNWSYLAGVGADPRGKRYFSMQKQASMYDPEARFIKHWVPELSGASSDACIRPSRLPVSLREAVGYPPMISKPHGDSGKTPFDKTGSSTGESPVPRRESWRTTIVTASSAASSRAGELALTPVSMSSHRGLSSTSRPRTSRVQHLSRDGCD
jgi:deoxyribodipyrimidine photo-lyase